MMKLWMMREIENLFWCRVDWSRGAQTINYVIAKNRVAPVGRVLGNFLDFLHDVDALRFHELTVVGFSLGGSFRRFNFFFQLTFKLLSSARRWLRWQDRKNWKDQHNHRIGSCWSTFYSSKSGWSVRCLRRCICWSDPHKRQSNRCRIPRRPRRLLPQQRSSSAGLLDQRLPPRSRHAFLHGID